MMPLKSVFNIRPKLPRYTSTWDVSIVLKYLEKYSPVKLLTRQPVFHIKYDIERTKRDRKSSKLFKFSVKPYKTASMSTISRGGKH